MFSQIFTTFIVTQWIPEKQFWVGHTFDTSNDPTVLLFSDFTVRLTVLYLSMNSVLYKLLLFLWNATSTTFLSNSYSTPSDLRDLNFFQYHRARWKASCVFSIRINKIYEIIDICYDCWVFFIFFQISLWVLSVLINVWPFSKYLNLTKFGPHDWFTHWLTTVYKDQFLFWPAQLLHENVTVGESVSWITLMLRQHWVCFDQQLLHAIISYCLDLLDQEMQTVN